MSLCLGSYWILCYEYVSKIDCYTAHRVLNFNTRYFTLLSKCNTILIVILLMYTELSKMNNDNRAYILYSVISNVDCLYKEYD